jgi:hypothetical protein
MSFLELLLAIPDLFALLEFTILLMSTPVASHSGLHNTSSTISSDATVHILITYVHPEHHHDKSFTDEKEQNMRRKYRRRHEDRESRSFSNLP